MMIRWMDPNLNYYVCISSSASTYLAVSMVCSRVPRNRAREPCHGTWDLGQFFFFLERWEGNERDGRGIVAPVCVS